MVIEINFLKFKKSIFFKLIVSKFNAVNKANDKNIQNVQQVNFF